MDLSAIFSLNTWRIFKIQTAKEIFWIWLAYSIKINAVQLPIHWYRGGSAEKNRRTFYQVCHQLNTYVALWHHPYTYGCDVTGLGVIHLQRVNKRTWFCFIYIIGDALLYLVWLIDWLIWKIIANNKTPKFRYANKQTSTCKTICGIQNIMLELEISHSSYLMFFHLWLSM